MSGRYSEPNNYVDPIMPNPDHFMTGGEGSAALWNDAYMQPVRLAMLRRLMLAPQKLTLNAGATGNVTIRHNVGSTLQPFGEVVINAGTTTITDGTSGAITASNRDITFNVTKDVAS